MTPGYLLILLIDPYILFCDMYRDCKALGVKDARPFVSEGNGIVMASPLYFCIIPPQKIKSFVERLYAISLHDRYPVKETALLMTAGDNGEKTFEQAKSKAIEM